MRSPVFPPQRLPPVKRQLYIQTTHSDLAQVSTRRCLQPHNTLQPVCCLDVSGSREVLKPLFTLQCVLAVVACPCHLVQGPLLLRKFIFKCNHIFRPSFTIFCCSVQRQTSLPVAPHPLMITRGLLLRLPSTRTIRTLTLIPKKTTKRCHGKRKSGRHMSCTSMSDDNGRALIGRLRITDLRGIIGVRAATPWGRGSPSQLEKV